MVGSNDLDKVWLTLLSVGDNYLIAGIVSHDGKLNVTGTESWESAHQDRPNECHWPSREAILSALRGKLPDIHAITVDKNGKEITVQAQVVHF